MHPIVTDQVAWSVGLSVGSLPFRRFPTGGSGEHRKLLQWVQAQPGSQMLFDAFQGKTDATCAFQ